MASATRVTLSLILSVSLLLGTVVGCSRAKPISAPTSTPEGTATPAGGLGLSSLDLTPSPTAGEPSPVPPSPTVAPSWTPTATPIPATPTASPVPMTPTPEVDEADAAAGAAGATSTPVAEELAAQSEVSYTVRWGDSLWALARVFGTTIDDIAALNGLVDTDFIRVGQALRIHTDVSTQPVPTVEYVVLPGDCLSILAQRFGTSVEELQRTNRIVNPWYIYAGQTLQVPSGTWAAGSGGTRYTVRPGDTLWHVAIRYSTTVWRIRIANNIRNPNLIYPGQVLIIP